MPQREPLDYAQAVAIGVAIQHPERAGQIFAEVRVEDFDGRYQLMAEAIHSLRIAKTDISALAVVDEMTRRGTIGRAGGSAEVHVVAGHGFGDAGYAVQVIARTARLRRLYRLGHQAGELTTLDDADPHTIARTMAEGAQAILDGIEAEGDVFTPSLREFLDRDDPEHDWVIPGLLERGDRLILTGSEGLGKSVMVRQLAVAAASGVHPFTHRPIDPVRVLLVDCENGPVKLRRALRPLAQQGERTAHDPRERMFVEAIPAGLDLTKPEDEMWLVRMVSALQPDLLLTGPVYRLHAKNPNDEEPARQVARVLDRCRAVANCAVVVEAHAGHGYGGAERPVRPTGTSLWLRWPEFGYGMRKAEGYSATERVVDLVPWRGDRDEREWPRRLRSGGLWPWSADDASSAGWSPAGVMAS